ncbi:hypothetical protein CYMTET_50564, partial [Cymbomonas tetramitiformis]
AFDRSGLSERELDILLEKMHFCAPKTGVRVASWGLPLKELLLVLEGELNVMHHAGGDDGTADDKEQIDRTYTAGEFVELSRFMASGELSPYNVVVPYDGVCLAVITTEEIDKLDARHPGIVFKLLTTACTRDIRKEYYQLRPDLVPPEPGEYDEESAEVEASEAGDGAEGGDESVEGDSQGTKRQQAEGKEDGEARGDVERKPQWTRGEDAKILWERDSNSMNENLIYITRRISQCQSMAPEAASDIASKEEHKQDHHKEEPMMIDKVFLDGSDILPNERVRRIAEIQRQSPHFRNLDPEEVTIVATYFPMFKVEAGEPIIHEGEPATFAALLMEGTAAISDPEDMKVAELNPGQIVGEIAMFQTEFEEKCGRAGNVVCLTACVWAFFPYGHFRELMRQYPQTGNKLLRMFTHMALQRLRECEWDLSVDRQSLDVEEVDFGFDELGLTQQFGLSSEEKLEMLRAACSEEMTTYLTASMLEVLAEVMVIAEASEGAAIIPDHFACTYTVIILTGKLQATVDEEGDRRVVAERSAGEWIGYHGFISLFLGLGIDSEKKPTWTAISPHSTYAVLSNEHMNTLIEQNPLVATSLTRLFAKKTMEKLSTVLYRAARAERAGDGHHPALFTNPEIVDLCTDPASEEFHECIEWRAAGYSETFGLKRSSSRQAEVGMAVEGEEEQASTLTPEAYLLGGCILDEVMDNCERAVGKRAKAAEETDSPTARKWGRQKHQQNAYAWQRSAHAVLTSVKTTSNAKATEYGMSAWDDQVLLQHAECTPACALQQLRVCQDTSLHWRDFREMELAWLATAGKMLRVMAGKPVFQKGQPSKCIVVVLHGVVSVVSQGACCGQVHAGGVLGELSMLVGGREGRNSVIPLHPVGVVSGSDGEAVSSRFPCQVHDGSNKLFPELPMKIMKTVATSMLSKMKSRKVDFLGIERYAAMPMAKDKMYFLMQDAQNTGPGLGHECTPGELHDLTDFFFISNIPAGEGMFREGMEATTMYLILEGEAVLSVGDGVRIGKGSIVGESSVMDSYISKATRKYALESVTDMQVAVIHRHQLYHLVRKSPWVATGAPISAPACPGVNTEAFGVALGRVTSSVVGDRFNPGWRRALGWHAHLCAVRG